MPIQYNIVFALIVSIHSRLCFELANTVFSKSKFHVLQYVFCIINAIIVLLLLQYLEEFSSLHYLFLVVLLLTQIRILFSATHIAIFTITNGLILHLFVFRAVIVSIVALANNLTISEIVQDSFFFWLTGMLSFIFHIIAIIVFNKLVPAKYLKTIEHNSELLTYIAIVCIILVSYMTYNANIYSLSTSVSGIKIQQIILPTVILILFYVSLLMLFNIMNLHMYKSKASELEDTILKESGIKSALFNMTKIYVEFSCTNDKLIRFVRHEKDVDISMYNSYTDFMHKTAQKYMHPDDIYKSQELEAKNIINLIKKGQNEITYEYRTPVYHESSKMPIKYIWHKLLMQSKIDSTTSEVTGFFLIYEIHDQKETQLLLQAKAERDSLTDGYNKTAAELYIDKILNETSQGTFFMIDLDNFKAINDTFGHTYGDTVLCDVYEKIKKHFRAHDIIARIGGDEFIVFATDNLSQTVLKEKAQELCNDIKYTYTNEDSKGIMVSASIGISQAPSDGLVYKRLFDKADKAMYRSKKDGKNTYSFFS